MTRTSHITEQNLVANLSAGAPLTMSSREIADLVEARHNDVVATIERQFAKGVLRESRKTLRPHHPPGGGRPTDVYDLTKRDSLVVASGYDDALRARIIDRWMELEQSKAAPQLAIDPSDPKVMLAVFGHLQKQVAEKDDIIAAQGVQVKALERLEAAKGSMCITDAAKTLGVGRDALTARMQAERWIYKRVGNKNWVAYHDKLMAGFLEHDDHIYLDSERRERVSTRALVTAKGLVRLAEILSRPLH